MVKTLYKYKRIRINLKIVIDVDVVGSVSQCEMLFRANIIAIVSGGSKPKFADNVLMLFDDAAKKFILEITFPVTIKAVRMTKDK